MSDDRRDDAGFLARWSKRKREARGGDPPPAERPAAPEPAPPATPAPAAQTRAPAEPAPPLPPIESLTHESDFTPFLREGVPAVLRNAALRKLWSDPAIRDAIGPARDYAWDWNAPGGVPGSGAPPTEEEIRAVLARLRGGPPPDAEKSRPSISAEAQASAPTSSSVSGDDSAGRPSSVPTTTGDEAADGEASSNAAKSTRRRHGGATPS
jgi:hypothetical protein